jgi:hypothetical protein
MKTCHPDEELGLGDAKFDNQMLYQRVLLKMEGK